VTELRYMVHYGSLVLIPTWHEQDMGFMNKGCVSAMRIVFVLVIAERVFLLKYVLSPLTPNVR